MDGTKIVKIQNKFSILVPTPEDDKEYACVNTCQFLPLKHLRVFADSNAVATNYTLRGSV
jgi:hypothetical protein